MIPLVKPFLPPSQELMPELEKILYSGYIAEGIVVKEFENIFSEYINNPYCLSVNSGTSALHLALLLIGVEKGDEVISTPLTAEPTNVALNSRGATIVWADVDRSNGLIDPNDVRRKITNKTKAIVVVHYAGMVVDMKAIAEISRESGIPIIEDAAHALGSKFNGKCIGSISPYTIFSFQAIKHMTTVDGGMLTLNSDVKYNEGRIRRWFGLDKTKPRAENNITIQGDKYHMNNVNATIGIVQMRHLKANLQKHKENGKFFDDNISETPGVQLVHYYPGSECAYWLYTLKVDDRDGFVNKLAENGIQASELHKRNDKHSIFEKSITHLPQLEEFYKKMVHIPCGWWVTNQDREKIVQTIKSGW